MLETDETKTAVEVHDPQILTQAKDVLDACLTPKEGNKEARAYG